MREGGEDSRRAPNFGVETQVGGTGWRGEPTPGPPPRPRQIDGLELVEQLAFESFRDEISLVDSRGPESLLSMAKIAKNAFFASKDSLKDLIGQMVEFGEIARRDGILALEGVEGKLFRPMALTVIFALIGSMIVSMTFRSRMP